MRHDSGIHLPTFNSGYLKCYIYNQQMYVYATYSIQKPSPLTPCSEYARMTSVRYVDFDGPLKPRSSKPLPPVRSMPELVTAEATH